MSTPIVTSDVIDRLAGIAPGSAIDEIRSHRQQARDNAQASFDVLFRPAEPGDVTRTERLALALYVVGLHRAVREAEFYASELAEAGAPAGLAEAIAAASLAGQAEGPAGLYTPGPLEGEGTVAPPFALPQRLEETLGRKLVAAFAHAQLLVFRPRESAAPALQDLLDAGWTTTGIVTLSQIVAFLAFQIRVVAGLRALDATLAA